MKRSDNKQFFDGKGGEEDGGKWDLNNWWTLVGKTCFNRAEAGVKSDVADLAATQIEDLTSENADKDTKIQKLEKDLQKIRTVAMHKDTEIKKLKGDLEKRETEILRFKEAWAKSKR